MCNRSDLVKGNIISEKVNAQFIAALKKTMSEHDWNQKDLAAALDMPPSRISNYFHNKSTPTAKTIQLIADRLGWNVEDLFNDGMLESSPLYFEKQSNQASIKIPYFGNIKYGPGLFGNPLPKYYIDKNDLITPDNGFFANSIGNNQLWIFRRSVLIYPGQIGIFSIPSKKVCICGKLIKQNGFYCEFLNIESGQNERYKLTEFRLQGVAVQSTTYYDYF